MLDAWFHFTTSTQSRSVLPVLYDFEPNPTSGAINPSAGIEEWLPM